MSFKVFKIEQLGEVTVYKRRGTRNIRLTIRSDNSLRVTIPTWMNYASGVQFVQARAEWINKHSRPVAALIEQNQLIGKAHRINFIVSAEAARVSSRIHGNEIKVSFPVDFDHTDPAVQKIARQAAIRALRQQAQALLPRRLNELATTHNLSFRSVVIKQLQTRWGSCDQSQNIALNLYLMQLPWELIDYVLLHELTHTIVMQHGPRFWRMMEQLEPRTQELRSSIKQYRTIIG